jgi:hypothetical protein
LDEDGYPHITYHQPDFWGGELEYAYEDGSGWHLETVDDAPGVGAYASLALDRGGYPHISYYDSTNVECTHILTLP